MNPILVLIHCTVLIGLNPFSRVKDLKIFHFWDRWHTCIRVWKNYKSILLQCKLIVNEEGLYYFKN